MGAGFGLPGLAHQLFAGRAGWKQSGFLAQALGLFGKAGFEGMDLFETSATLHDTLPCACGSYPAWFSTL
jgi:hypothetical protein